MSPTSATSRRPKYHKVETEQGSADRSGAEKFEAATLARRDPVFSSLIKPETS
jgi:hypothetical protein